MKHVTFAVKPSEIKKRNVIFSMFFFQVKNTKGNAIGVILGRAKSNVARTRCPTNLLFSYILIICIIFDMYLMP
jgi:hypothetical protein